MLATPCKQGISVNIATPFHSLLTQTHSESVADFHTESCSKLQRNRDLCLTVATKAAKPEQLSIYSTYLRNLASLEAKFTSEDQEKMLNLGGQFPWKDTFITSTKIDYQNVVGERAAVLFNFAALHSRLGVSMDLSNPAELVTASEYFKMSASIFLFLRDDYLPGKIFPRSADLNHDALTMVSNMMLAQAQLCFFKKARMNKLSSTVTSKLAKGISDFFDKALQSSQSRHMKEILARSWSTNITFQRNFYLGYAEYYKGFVFKEIAEDTTEGFGKFIAQVTEGARLLRQCIQYGQDVGLSQVVISQGTNLLQEVEKTLDKANEENQTVYLDPVPTRAALPALESHAIVKKTIDKFQPWWMGKLDLTQETSDDVFYNLLPAKVESYAAEFERRFRENIVTVESTISGEVSRVKEMLAEANLPYLIEAGDPTSNGVPDDLFKRIQTGVQSRNGAAGLRQEITDNQNKNNTLRKLTQDNLNSLRSAENHHKEMKGKFGDRWNLPDPAEANAKLTNDCLKFLGYLTEGGNNDTLLLNKLSSNENATRFDTLMFDKASMSLLVPDTTGVDDDEAVEAIRTKLRMSYINLDSKLGECEAASSNLKKSVSEEIQRFKAYLSQNQDFGDEDVVGMRLAQNMSLIDSLYVLKDSLSPLLARVLEDSAKYMASRQQTSMSQERTQALAGLSNALEAYESIGRHVFEGKMYYEDLEVKIQKLDGLVKDSIFTRDFIAKELEDALKEANITPRTQNDDKRHTPAIQRQKSEIHLGRPQNDPVAAPQPTVGLQQPAAAVDANGYPVMAPVGQQVMPGYNPYAYNPHMVPMMGYQPMPGYMQPGMAYQPMQPGYYQAPMPVQPANVQYQPPPAQTQPAANVNDKQPQRKTKKTGFGFFGRKG
eukprot:maker-scaffold_19-snap-gene-5.59-mRNA-1 protein AED:0.00 eAED:0.00 QI:163/1/1/1/1/1/2/117/887